ncbi:hypothetical protein E2C01_009783 [Portunus trituberculatus]|uniref:Uncharacterized protein n=1 Tax=Portunus trituberculatus TaxID=210409 RepID=A0A5B7D6N0_PORTR|nr:hypothetical protein [Portunus trituberculatus]
MKSVEKRLKSIPEKKKKSYAARKFQPTIPVLRLALPHPPCSPHNLPHHLYHHDASFNITPTTAATAYTASE